MNIHVRPALVIKTEIFIFFGLLFLNFIALILKDDLPARWGNRLFYFASFDKENNIPTFFAILLFLQAAILTFLIYRQAVVNKKVLLILSILFLFFAFDEYASLHERLINPFRALLGVSGFLYFTWIVPYAAIVVGLFFILYKWFFSLPAKIRNGFFLSACIYLSGAVIVESIGGWYFQGDPTARNSVYFLITTLEESLEKLGLMFYAWCCLQYLSLLSKNGITTISLIHDKNNISIDC